MAVMKIRKSSSLHSERKSEVTSEMNFQNGPLFNNHNVEHKFYFIRKIKINTRAKVFLFSAYNNCIYCKFTTG